MNNKLFYYFICTIGLVSIFQSCKKEYENIEITDERKIQEYISKNGLSMTKDPSGFYYQILSPGTGPLLENKDSVFFSQNFKSLSGSVYTETKEYSNSGNYVGYLSSKYSKIYPGDAYRIVMNKVGRGGSFRVVIPSYLAFGKNGLNNIPGNEVLISDVSVFNESSQMQIDDRRINKFLKDKSLVAVPTFSGLYSILMVQGTGGELIKPTSSVTVKFTGRLLDGTVFDQTKGDDVFGAALNGGVIAGWTEGLVGLTAGSKVRLFIPSGLAYGTEGHDPIPPNSCLDFEIEIVTVTN